jgi:protein-tyrosine phosphatase
MKIRLCFVCTGNICRSPTAEGIMLALVEAAGLEEWIAVDSAGIDDWHSGEAADPRSRATAAGRGIDLQSISRAFGREDFSEFEYVLAMDATHHAELSSLTPDPEDQEKIFLLRDFEAGAQPGREVPDPYYGGNGGFDDVFDIIDRACRELLDHLRLRHGLPS